MSIQDTLNRQFREVARKIIPDNEFNTQLRELMNSQLKYAMKPEVNGFMPEIHVFGIIKNETGKRKHGQFLILNENFNDKKYEIIHAMGKDFAGMNNTFPPCMLFMVSEAWVASYESKDEQAIKDGTFIRPANRPDKKEVLVVAGLTVDGRSNMAIAEIIRNPNGKLTGLINTSYTADYVNDDKKDGKNNLLEEFLRGYTMGLVEKNK